MKKFIIKSFLFVAPFIVLYSLNFFLYNQQEGDLVRLGYLYSNPLPKSLIYSKYRLKKKYQLLSETNLDTTSDFDIFLIGDSFSQQDSLGFKNFIAHQGQSVVHVDNFLSGEDPVETLLSYINSDLFTRVKPKYIVLETIEREFLQRCLNINFTKTTSIQNIQSEIVKRKPRIRPEPLGLFSSSTLKIPLTNLLYNFSSKPSFSQTYKFESKTDQLFSTQPNSILIFENDIKNLLQVKDSSQINRCISNLNQINKILTEKGIMLLFMVAPNKYTLYYDFISDKSKLKEPSFFEHYIKSDKEFVHIPTYEILSEEVKVTNDLYYYDDTHWSPKAAKIIANEIISITVKK
jgi:hypothetical protein